MILRYVQFISSMLYGPRQSITSLCLGIYMVICFAALTTTFDLSQIFIQGPYHLYAWIIMVCPRSYKSFLDHGLRKSFPAKSQLTVSLFMLSSAADQKRFDLTRKIVLWLIEQRDERGGFTTTQDTVVGLQALADYMIWSNIVVSWK